MRWCCQNNTYPNLGYHLVQKKRWVLLIDMNQQASLTSFMGVEPEAQEKTIYHAIIEEEPIPNYTQKNSGNGACS